MVTPVSPPDHGQRTRGRQIRSGISWNVVNLVVNKGVSILARLLLAHLLAPEYFGLIAMAVVLLELVNIVSDFGLKNTLIQRSHDARSPLIADSAFWFLAGAGLLWALAYMVLGVPALVWFYGEPALTDFAWVMGWGIFLQSLSAVPLARLTRRMKFRQIVIAEITALLVAASAAIALAVWGAGVWSLVAQHLVSAGVESLMLLRAAQWRPRWRFSWQRLGDLVGLSGYMMGNRLIHFLRTNVDTVIAGHILGASALGLYAMAYVITETVRGAMTRVLTRVLFPAFSKIKSDRKAVQDLFARVTNRSSLLVFPISISLIFHADELVPLAFTTEWLGMVPVIRLLSLSGIIYVISGPASEALQGIGRPEALLRISTVNLLVVVIPATILCTQKFGITGTAAASVLGMLTLRASLQVALHRHIGISFLSMCRGLLPVLALALGCAIAHFLLRDKVHFLILITGYFLVFYSTLIYLERKSFRGFRVKGLRNGGEKG